MRNLILPATAILLSLITCKKQSGSPVSSATDTINSRYCGSYYGTYWVLHTDSPYIQGKPTIVSISKDSSDPNGRRIIMKSENWVLPIHNSGNYGYFEVDNFRSSYVEFGKDSGIIAEIRGTPTNKKLFWWDCPSGPK